MGLFDHFPYTNVHELNLDWVLSMMKALEAEWEAFIAGNSLTFADPLQHDISKTYAKNTIVLDGNGNAYVSLHAVPVGVGLQNGDYWLMVFDYEAFIEKVNKNFTARYYRGSYRATAAMAIGDWLTVDDVLCKATAAIAADDVLELGVNIDHFTLEDFIKAFMQSANQLIQQYKNDIDASELAYRQQLAQDIANTTSSLQAQLDAAIAGVTVDSEVINARIGADGVTYPTLGDAIRTQFSDITNYAVLGNTTYFNASTSASICGNDLNNLPNNKIYTIGSDLGTTVSNAPYRFGSGGCLISFTSSINETRFHNQIFISRYGGIYHRTCYLNTWTSWESYSDFVTDANKYLVWGNTTYFNASTSASICSDDLNNLPNNKIYIVGSDASGVANSPNRFQYGGCLISIVSDVAMTQFHNQIFISRYGFIAYRTCYFGSWTAWKYDNESIFANLNAVALGDSLCRGGRNSGKGFIGDVGCNYVNIGVGGATLSTVQDVSSSTDSVHPLGATNIADELVKYSAQTAQSWYLDPDAIIAEGGINDYYYNAPLGSLPAAPIKNDTEAAAVDQSTVSGGLQYLFYQMIKLYPFAKRFFLITHKTRNYQWTANSAGYNQTQLHDFIVSVAKMYDVVIMDVYEESVINSYYDAYVSPTAYSDDPSVTNQYYVDSDRIHTLALGYTKAYVPIVKSQLVKALT